MRVTFMHDLLVTYAGAERVIPLSKDSNNHSGILFENQTLESLTQAITEFELNEDKFSAGKDRLNAERFSIDRFRNEFEF